MNLGLFASGMVCLFGGTRQMCWRVLSATLQASKCCALLCTHDFWNQFVTKLVGVNSLKWFRVVLHVCATDYNHRVQVLHICMPV